MAALSPHPGRQITVDHLLARPGHAGAAGRFCITAEENRILAITPAASGNAGAGWLAMPALCNAHDHGRGLRSLAVGAADEALELWMPAQSAEPVVDPYLRAAVAFARMAESGICATNHCHNTQAANRLLQEAEGVARAAKDVGIRVAFAIPFFDRNRFVYGDIAPLLHALPPADAARARQQAVLAPAAERFALVDEIAALQNPWFSIQYGPVGPQWVTDATLRRIAEDSARTGRRVHMHAFETRLQREWADAAYPNGYFAYLDEIGLLSPRLTLAHAVWLTQPEAELLAQRGVTVSLNASSNLRLRSGVPPVALCLNAKLRFGIGLDGMAIDDDEDMLREIRLLRHLANGASPGLEGSGLTDAHLFDAALAVGRHSILGADGGGAIDVGAPADMLVLDFAAMTSDCLAAEPDPLPVLLTRMARRHVQQLMVAGRMIVDGGTCRSVDLPALQAELLAQARHVRAADGTDEATRTRLRTAIRAYYGCVCRPAAMGATHGA